MTTTTTRAGGREKFPTLVLKKRYYGGFVLDHNHLVFLHIEMSFLLLKQKDNIDPCGTCGPGFVVSRKGDTIRPHP